MENIKWYKSSEAVSEIMSRELAKGVMEYYTKETSTDQTKLYTAFGNYYLKTPDPERLFIYVTSGSFSEVAKPARKHLSPL